MDRRESVIHPMRSHPLRESRAGVLDGSGEFGMARRSRTNIMRLPVHDSHGCFEARFDPKSACTSAESGRCL
jgi:hypothetical protein